MCCICYCLPCEDDLRTSILLWSETLSKVANVYGEGLIQGMLYFPASLGMPWFIAQMALFVYMSFRSRVHQLELDVNEASAAAAASTQLAEGTRQGAMTLRGATASQKDLFQTWQTLQSVRERNAELKIKTKPLEERLKAADKHATQTWNDEGTTGATPWSPDAGFKEPTIDAMRFLSVIGLPSLE